MGGRSVFYGRNPFHMIVEAFVKRIDTEEYGVASINIIDCTIHRMGIVWRYRGLET